MASNCFPNLRAKDKDKGTSSQTLIYYSSVAGGRPKLNILAEYVDANDHDKELPRIASNCLRFLPPHHYHFSFTANMRMFACIIEEPFIYCAIADEALNRSNVIAFLEQLRHEFLKYAKDKGVLVDNHDHDHDQSKLKTHSLDKHFKPVFKRLVSPLTGMTQHEKCRIAEEARARQRAEARAAAEAKAEADARAKAEAETETGFEPKSVASIQEDQRVQGDIEVGFESVSPDDASAYERYDPSATIEKCSSGSRSPSAPLINKDHGKCLPHIPCLLRFHTMNLRNFTRLFVTFSPRIFR